MFQSAHLSFFRTCFKHTDPRRCVFFPIQVLHILHTEPGDSLPIHQLSDTENTDQRHSTQLTSYSVVSQPTKSTLRTHQKRRSNGLKQTSCPGSSRCGPQMVRSCGQSERLGPSCTQLRATTSRRELLYLRIGHRVDYLAALFVVYSLCYLPAFPLLLQLLEFLLLCMSPGIEDNRSPDRIGTAAASVLCRTSLERTGFLGWCRLAPCSDDHRLLGGPELSSGGVIRRGGVS
jgi:hypothetical protein